MTGPSLRDRAAQHKQGGDPGKEVDLVAQDETHLTSLAGYLQRLTPQLDRAMPRHLNADRIARIALNEVRRNPKLATTTPTSFAGSLLTASALGLEIGPGGEAYLVPYEWHKGPMRGQVECQLIVGYQGITKLFLQHPLAADISAHAVYDADDFDYAYGTDKFLRHRPSRLPVADRGDVTHYYAVASLTTGATHFEVFTPDEIRKLRKGKVGSQGDIDDPQRWMERKTAIRQVLKPMPKSAQLAVALAADDNPSGTELYHARVTDVQVEQDISTPINTPAAVEERAPHPAEREAADLAHKDPPAESTHRDATRKQVGLIQGNFDKLGIDDRDERLAFVCDVIGSEVSSTNDLNTHQASQVIEVQKHHLEEKQRAEGGE